MDANLEALARELTALTQRFADLGAKLGDAARALEEAGAPPPDRLVDDLEGARTQFIQLRTDVLTAAQAASIPPKGEPESLTELEPLLGAISTSIRRRAKQGALQETQQALVATLDRVLEVTHRDDPAFAALVGCQSKARALREAALALTDPASPEAQRVGASAQPFADLLMMIERRDAIDDERYAELEESVSRAFGRGLAVAMARNRLTFAGDAVQPTPAPTAPSPEPRRPAPLADAPPVLAAPPTETPPIELEIAAPPPVPEPATAVVDQPVTMPTIEMPSLTVEPEPEPEPVAAAAPPPKPTPPVKAAPPSKTPASGAEPSGPDETAQWWLAAWARWSGWKATHDFASVVRDEIGKYPYLLSVPIQRSPEYEEGLLAYGYSILIDHVEKQNPGCVGNALNSLQPAVARPVGDQLYDYLVTQGDLRETYPDFVKNALLAAVPDPGVWFQFRILESKEDTRIFQRPSARLGDTELAGQRLASDAQRYAEHKFKMMLPPLTTRCVLVSADSIRDARGVGVKLAADGTASDSGWVLTVAAGGRGKTDARRVGGDGTHVSGLGKDFGSVWIAVFNPDPAGDRRYELSVFMRKDTKSPFRRG